MTDDPISHADSRLTRRGQQRQPSSSSWSVMKKDQNVKTGTKTTNNNNLINIKTKDQER